MNFLNKLFKRVFQNSLINHLLFWALSYYVLLNIFSNNGEYHSIDIIYTIIFMFSLMIPVLLNLYFLFTNLLFRKKYWIYILTFITTILSFSYLNYQLFNSIIDYILPGYYFISYYEYIDILKFFAVFLISTSLIKLSKNWFALIEFKRKLSVAEKEKMEIELKALRSQVNPHFLFNSLNVLYSLALKNSNKTAETIIKLSDVLRYVIYDSNKELVEISSEVALINDYLAIQSYRIDDTSDISFETDIQHEAKIPPMLLLPLVENSFKHGVKGDILNTFVKIKLISNEKEIIFEIENNKGLSENPTKQQEGGIGLSNIRKRLDFLYPGKHTFTISEDDSKFKVILKIEL